jgi:hypothetical protein
MALWGNNDNISAAGRVTLDYATGIVLVLPVPPMVLYLVKLVASKKEMLLDLDLL